ncbi:hypothetical protein SEPCBS57363_006138 [Sporothrix epigloea]|uniref:Uncharacterized protein n=1 Tax=Sporothrix epigloea TaxID=1892477 RepID=A0ABP0E1D5_9PEZI
MDATSHPVNQYGLNHGYAFMPNPYDPYGWQAYEQECARRQTLEAVAQQQAGLAAVLSEVLSSDSSPSAMPYTSSSLQLLPSSGYYYAPVCDLDDDDDERRRRKKKKCSGLKCWRKSLSLQRAGPHWCDGKNWGGKVWGLTRSPGDKNRSNWLMYYDPEIDKSEVQAICRRDFVITAINTLATTSQTL